MKVLAICFSCLYSYLHYSLLFFLHTNYSLSHRIVMYKSAKEWFIKQHILIQADKWIGHPSSSWMLLNLIICKWFVQRKTCCNNSLSLCVFWNAGQAWVGQIQSDTPVLPLQCQQIAQHLSIHTILSARWSARYCSSILIMRWCIAIGRPWKRSPLPPLPAYLLSRWVMQAGCIVAPMHFISRILFTNGSGKNQTPFVWFAGTYFANKWKNASEFDSFSESSFSMK